MKGIFSLFSTLTLLAAMAFSSPASAGHYYDDYHGGYGYGHMNYRPQRYTGQRCYGNEAFSYGDHYGRRHYRACKGGYLSPISHHSYRRRMRNRHYRHRGYRGRGYRNHRYREHRRRVNRRRRHHYNHHGYY